MEDPQLKSAEIMDQSLILHGVVAYVEVRSSNDNRSAAICQELIQLGAQVEPAFTEEVTHVVFKEGLKRTWTKAVKNGLPLVSVSWLESCKQNQMHMPEKDFPAILPEDGSSPIPKLNQPRWKKMKSMQPRDFDEEVTRSAERGEKRRKRVMMANRFKLAEETTPISAVPAPILALETQFRSPMCSALSKSTPVPDTPPSLKERLERMRREQKQLLGTEEEPVATPRPPAEVPQQRRLFGKFASDFMSTEDSSEEDDTSQVVAKLIQGLDSNSESGSQSPTSRKDRKAPQALDIEKSADNLAHVSKDSIAGNRTITTPPAKRRKSLRQSESHPKHNNLTSDINSNQNSLKTQKDSGSNNIPKYENTKDLKSDGHNISSHEKKTRRSVTSALSPKDMNTDDSSETSVPIESGAKSALKSVQSNEGLINNYVNGKEAELKENYHTLKSATALSPKQATTDTFRHEVAHTASKPAPPVPDVPSEEALLGKVDVHSPQAGKNCSAANKQVQRPQNRRQSRRISSAGTKPQLASAVDNTSAQQSRDIAAHTKQKFTTSAQDVPREPDSTEVSASKKKMGSSPQHVPSALLKPKTTKKKRNLYTESVFSAPLPCQKDTAVETKDATDVPLSKKPTNKVAASQAKLDVSFLFKASNIGESRPEENDSRRKSRRLSAVSAQNAVVKPGDTNTDKNPSGRKRQVGSCLPKAAVENQSDHMRGSRHIEDSSLGDFLSKTDPLGTSMSVVYGNDTTMSNAIRAGTSRRSINEFVTSTKPSGKVKKQRNTVAVPTLKRTDEHDCKEIDATRKLGLKKDKTIKKGVKQKNEPQTTKRRGSGSSSSDKHSAPQTQVKKQKGKAIASHPDTSTSNALNESSAADQAEDPPSRLRHARSLVMEQTTLLINKKSPYSLVMTSLHREEQEIVYSVVKKLGIFHMTNNVEASTTHVVCGDPRRTLNVLKAIARGCWLLRMEWVLQSLEAGEWLLEEDYEMHEIPAGKKSRSARQAIGSGYKPDLFSKTGPIYVSNSCTPPRRELVHLINLCNGHVTGSEIRAALHLGDDHNPDKLVIKPTWVLDCIMKLETLPTDEYLVSAPVSWSQRESSPEF